MRTPDGNDGDPGPEGRGADEARETPGVSVGGADVWADVADAVADPLGPQAGGPAPGDAADGGDAGVKAPGAAGERDEAAAGDDSGGGAAPGPDADAAGESDRSDQSDHADRADSAERLAEEARRFAEAVAGKLGGVRQRVVDPLLERHPEAAAHLSAAGSELLAAYRAFVTDKERRWASRPAPTQRVDLDD
ncbi:hypothetical protein GCM10023205_15680 [Yinghuangia aomiensis]|uniref:Uncharacterized protein n=1 Tax=Yinghuangia aomiensis TaxID=676205 RepID=A0ABP9GZA4_9ACTN